VAGTAAARVNVEVGTAVTIDGTAGGAGLVTLGAGRLERLIAGAPGVSITLYLRPLQVSGLKYQRVVFTMWNAHGAALWVNLNAADSGKILVGGRSRGIVSDEGFKEVTGNSGNLANVPVVVTGVLDFAGDSIRVYRNGQLDGTAAVAFAADAYSPGAASVNTDGLGHTITPADTLNAVVMGALLHRRPLSAAEALAVSWELRRGCPTLLSRPVPSASLNAAFRSFWLGRAPVLGSGIH
jgi:hypothetical protein